MPNKKISQLVNKTTILSTDLFPIGDATSGQLYKKTIAELQAAIGGAVISVNGLVGTVVLDTDDIQELATPTNKYFTDARARAALSATSPLAFNSSTGVFSMPAATTSANGYLTSTDWNTFNGKENVLTFSSPLVRTVNTISMPAATTSVNGYLSSTDWNTFNNKQGALTLTVTGSSGASTLIGNTLNVPTYTLAGLGGITASFLSGGTGITYNSGTGVIATTITQYTDALARASLSFAAGSGAYNSTTGVITIPTNTNQLTNGASFITLGSLSGGTGISYNSTTGAISSTITQYTDALARAAISGGTGISYNSTTGVITNTITQYTDALARASLSFTAGSGGYNSTTGVITIPTNNNQITNGAGYITSASLSGYVTGSGTTNYLPKFTSSSGIGNSLIYDDGSNILIGSTTNTQGAKLKIAGGYIYINETSGADVYLRSAYDGNKAAIQVASANDLAFVTSNVTRMILNSSGNLCLGQTLSAWGSDKKALQLGIGASYYGSTSTYSQNFSLANSYFDGTNFVYIGTDSATQYRQNGGIHSWYNAPSGTAGTAITFTQAMTLNSSGNLGLGVTPSAWSGNWKAIQLNGGSIFNYLTSEIHLGQNFYYSTSSIANYQNNGFASDYWQYNGQHIWMTAPSGTAGNAITFTQAMTLDASGRLGIGTSSPTTKVDISYADNNYAGGLTITNTTNGSQAQSKINIVNSAGTILSLMSQSPSVNSGVSFITTSDTTPLVFGTAYIEKIRITNNGNLLVGTTTDSGYKLDVNGTGRFSGNLQVNGFIYTPSASSSANLSGFVSQYSGNASSRSWKITNDVVEYGDYAIQQSTTQTGTTYASKLYFNAVGAATFSSSVTVNGGYIRNANTATSGGLFMGNGNIYMAYDGTNINFVGAPATFSSSVTATQFNASSKLTWGTATDGTTGQIATDNTNNYFDYKGNLYFRGATASNTLITFTSAGAATFSSSVTVGATAGGALNIAGNTINNGVVSILKNSTYSNEGSAAIAINSSNSAASVELLIGADNTNNLCYIQTAAQGSSYTSARLALQPNGGLVGIGTSNPSALLHVLGTESRFGGVSSSFISFYNATGRSGYIQANGGTDLRIASETDPMTFYVNSADRGRITTGGNWLLGTSTDNGERLYVSGAIRATGTITANSDIRLKKNLERIENALEKVGQISGYTYNTIYDDKRHGGVIAQEVDEVFPEIVNKGNDGLLGVEYGNISALLIEALKELKEKNTALEARLQALEK